ncbi:conserved protein of unknown function [Rhodovastum atsumiense]|uniref:Uncharacterized protein n=1 Tax=Rhodovastum atsumiense TaxID=504468 RepID=A0A5M6ISY6_9PROT|nr:hypothetical protein [Rhodovastum atsumiense]KAA5611321.1 hypothetical protein F1189_15350 [Rhodovastum atsumiense]CAH2601796.1 conserved protein of unknown function [Rhodovastum atsumiense]
MATHQARLLARRAAPPPSLPRSDVDDLVDAAEPLADVRAVVIGAGSVDVLCALLRRGCAAATMLRPDLRAPTEVAELVVLSASDSAPGIGGLLRLARRRLQPDGRIVLRERRVTRTRDLTSLLAAQGFTSVRCRVLHSGAVLSTTLPAVPVAPAPSAGG